MTLAQGKTDTTYIVDNIQGKKDIENFLLTLGCYNGEEITIISKLASNYIVNIKDARYSIDERLAKAIVVN